MSRDLSDSDSGGRWRGKVANQAGHDAGVVNCTAVVGVRDDYAAFFSRQIYGVDEPLAAIAGELCKQTGFEPEDAEASSKAQSDGLPEAIKGTVNVAAEAEAWARKSGVCQRVYVSNSGTEMRWRWHCRRNSRSP